MLNNSIFTPKGLLWCLCFSKTKTLLILACCDHFRGAVSAQTSVPVRRDGDVVPCPALQRAEVTARVGAVARVSLTRFVDRRHRVHDSRRAAVPGNRHDPSATVDGLKEGRQRARS